MIDKLITSYCNDCPDNGSEECKLPSRKEVLVDKVRVGIGLVVIGHYQNFSFGRDPRRTMSRYRELYEPRFQAEKAIADCVKDHRLTDLAKALEDYRAQTQNNPQEPDHEL